MAYIFYSSNVESTKLGPQGAFKLHRDQPERDSATLNERLLLYLQKEQLQVGEQHMFCEPKSCLHHVVELSTCRTSCISENKAICACFRLTESFSNDKYDLLAFKCI